MSPLTSARSLGAVALDVLIADSGSATPQVGTTWSPPRLAGTQANDVVAIATAHNTDEITLSAPSWTIVDRDTDRLFSMFVRRVAGGESGNQPGITFHSTSAFTWAQAVVRGALASPMVQDAEFATTVDTDGFNGTAIFPSVTLTRTGLMLAMFLTRSFISTPGTPSGMDEENRETTQAVFSEKRTPGATGTRSGAVTDLTGSPSTHSTLLWSLAL